MRTWTLTFLFGFFATQAFASLHPEAIHTAENKKISAYIQDGLFVGGDRIVDDVVIKDIRRANNPNGFERIVIDLEGSTDRAPYYQVAVQRAEKRMVITLWGKPKMAAEVQKVVKAFGQSKNIGLIQFLPQMETDFVSFVIQLKKVQPVEIFELSSPSRIIIDLKNQ